jgi:hypothetical protein
MFGEIIAGFVTGLIDGKKIKHARRAADASESTAEELRKLRSEVQQLRADNTTANSSAPIPRIKSPDITFSCGWCGQGLVIEEAGAGLAVDCPKCKQPLTVP